MSKSVLVIKGSPHISGATSYLADEFAAGALAAGNDVKVYNAGAANINACSGCDYCRGHDGECCVDDEMKDLYVQIFEADVVVLATPLHYFSFSAQMKAAISRLHAVNGKLKKMDKVVYLLSSAGSASEEVFDAINMVYDKIIGLFGWQDGGRLLVCGHPTMDAMKESDYGRNAYDMGAGIR